MAAKNAMLLLEATVGIIMETINLIETTPDLTPEEALDVQVTKFGPWTATAAARIKTKV